MFSNQFTLTKRQLGILLLAGGLIILIGLLALDTIFGGRDGGIGPAQRLALICAGLIALIGLSLIPLGDTPA
ncbi:MAG: hypothetical protein H7X77_04160 [Anaerolineae bacterium]|nr:hypothetical protein [Anaerolineae bacterium]